MERMVESMKYYAVKESYESTPDKGGRIIRFTHAIYRTGSPDVVFRARTVAHVDELLKNLRETHR